MVYFSSPQLTYKDNILYYKIVKIMINAPGFAEVILNVVVHHHCLLGSVVTNNDSIFLPKTWHCYVTSTALYLQTSGSTKRPNSSWQSIFSKFSIQAFYMLFKLSCRYCPRIFKLKMLLPPRYLQNDPIYSYLPHITARAASTRKERVYKNTI